MNKPMKQYKRDQRERDKKAGLKRLDLRVTEKEKEKIMDFLKGLRCENNLSRLQTKKETKANRF